MPARACVSDADEAAAPELRRRRFPWLRAGLTILLCVGTLSYLALVRRDSSEAAVARSGSERFAETVFAPSWQLLPANQAFSDIDAAAAGQALRRESRVNSGTGLREDTILLGSFETPQSHLALTLERGALPAERLGLFVDLTRRAAPAGLAILRLAPIEPLPTKFGEVEAALVTLAGRAERSCLAFRWSDSEPGFGFKGWHCAAEPSAARAELICLIDRLAPAASADRPLRLRFAQADSRRLAACRALPSALVSRAAQIEPPRNTKETSRN